MFSETGYAGYVGEDRPAIELKKGPSVLRFVQENTRGDVAHIVAPRGLSGNVTNRTVSRAEGERLLIEAKADGYKMTHNGTTANWPNKGTVSV